MDLQLKRGAIFIVKMPDIRTDITWIWEGLLQYHAIGRYTRLEISHRPSIFGWQTQNISGSDILSGPIC